MSRLTGSDIKSMMEAYVSVYDLQEEEVLGRRGKDWYRVKKDSSGKKTGETKLDPSKISPEAKQRYERLKREADVKPQPRNRLDDPIAGTGPRGNEVGSPPEPQPPAPGAKQPGESLRDYAKRTEREASQAGSRPPAPASGSDGSGSGAGSAPPRPAAPVLSKRKGVEGTGVGANFKERAFTDAERSRYASVAAKNAAAKPAPASQLSPGGRASNEDLKGKTFATGTTAGGTKFERRTPTSAEMAASKAAGGGEAGVKSAVERSSKLMGGPGGAGKIDTSSVQRDLAKANAPKPAATPTPTPAAAPKAPTRRLSAADQRQGIRASYEYDAYDLVLEYLLAEGHADTLEEANYVMLEMDAEMVQDIVEQQTSAIRADAPRPGQRTVSMTATGKEPIGNRLAGQAGQAIGNFVRGINPKALKSTPAPEPRKPLVSTPKPGPSNNFGRGF